MTDATERLVERVADAVMLRLERRRVEIAAEHGVCACPLCGTVLADHRLQPGAVKVADIVGVVAAHFELTLDAIRSERRSRDVAHPRQIAMFLARELTRASTGTIARALRRDHSTVIEGARAVRGRINGSAEFAAEIATLRRRCLALLKDREARHLGALKEARHG